MRGGGPHPPPSPLPHAREGELSDGEPQEGAA